MFFFSSRRRHTRLTCDWSSDVCSSDLAARRARAQREGRGESRLYARLRAGARGGEIGSRGARARRSRLPRSNGWRIDLSRRGAGRRCAVPPCRRGAPDRQRRRGRRHLYEPRRASTALLPGQTGAGDGAARRLGVGSACIRHGPGGGAAMTFFLVSSAIKVFVVFNLIMVGVALLTLLERRVCAWMQDRLGPNRVGPQGILQPAADGLKNFLKEETSPAMADKALFTLAPIVSFVPALLTFGVIPFAAPLP